MADVFPLPVVHITTSDLKDKAPRFLPLTPPKTQILGPTQAMTYVYSTPPALTVTDDADLTHHLAAEAPGPPFLYFPVAGGSAIAYLDFGPNPEQGEGFMHRTQTIDYIVVLEGELELNLGGEEKRVVKKGDVVVQRATMHSWKNLSKTEGARCVAVSLGAEGAVEGKMEFAGEPVVA